MAYQEYIYVILCENDKYYVGKTGDVSRRWKEHVLGVGSSWTRIHKPVKIISAIESTSKFDEDKITLEYMDKYGVHSVRGGSFSSPTLSVEDVITLQKILNHGNNLCMKCYKIGHTMSSCNIDIIQELKLDCQTLRERYNTVWLVRPMDSYVWCFWRLGIQEEKHPRGYVDLRFALLSVKKAQLHLSVGEYEIYVK